MLPHIEKTIHFLAKSPNPSSVELLRFFLHNIEQEVRESALEALYLKKDSAILLELFHLVSANEQEWLSTAFLTPERMGRLAEEAIRSGDIELAGSGCSMAIRNNLYETMPAIVSLLEVPRSEWGELSAVTILKLANCFYQQLAAAASDLERRNMDRRRDWFAAQMEEPVRRFSIHRRIEPVQAFLLVAKRNSEFLVKTLGDVHSQVCKTIVGLLQDNNEGCYYRLLLGFVGDSSSPPVIDLILTAKDDQKFISNLLKLIGDNPPQATKDALKRFKGFCWIDSGNDAIPQLIAGEEAAFVQLIANSTLPRETTLAMFELIFKLPSIAGRRAAIKAIRAFNGDDVNRLLIAAANDTDAEVCSEAIRVMKAKRVKEVDQIIMQKYEHPSPQVRETIYELMPEFRIDTFFQKIGQMTENMSRILGRIVRNVDPNVRKRINEEITSAIPVRRRLAIDAARYTELAPEYEEPLIQIAENDSEIEVRIAAYKALAHVLTNDAWQTLQQASVSHNMALQQVAMEASGIWRSNLEQNHKETAASAS
ncbi:MAG: hypothetical protein FWD31_07305 [Planctomycetaceae bacterium]|nr:hypothetical protein [Planctomycetaceae bacterium]